MVGVGGTRPKTKGQKVAWWVLASIFAGFIAYVLIHNYIRQ
jgi:hypothetical protein